MLFNKKLTVSVCFALVVSFVFSVVSFAKTSEKIRGEVLRLHVIANSDSDADQRLKLEVRDAVLKEAAEIFDGSVNVENAVSRIEPEKDRIIKIAERVIAENGFDYGVTVSIRREYFTTRTYENVTLPAGKYLAFRIVIGEGKGHNWWCVMFPPMCLPAADKREKISTVLGSGEMHLVVKNPKYEVRFKIIEICEDVKNKIEEYRKNR